MEIVDFKHLNQILKDHDLWGWGYDIERISRRFLENNPHGHTSIWLETISKFPQLNITGRDINSPAITVRTEQDFDRESLETELRRMLPWRKGPFDIHGIYMDTEWRSDWKWQRLIGDITPLAGRKVLDIGCGNGYYLWRMLGAGARCALGVDPVRLFVAQFQAIRHFMGRDLPAAILPTGIDELPFHMPAFDTIFSMGVLYHRRDPRAHIERLKSLLLSGGELILETLIIENDDISILKPAGRYAKMRNVHRIPSIPLLQQWLKNIGMQNIRIIDISPTTPNEQRTTGWMPFESLKDFLDLADPSKTIEGYPAPVRAIIAATGE